MNRIIIFIPKLKGNKQHKERWLLKNFGSGVISNPCVFFIEKLDI